MPRPFLGRDRRVPAVVRPAHACQGIPAQVAPTAGRCSPAHCDIARPPEAGVTFPPRMSSLPVTCRSPPRPWRSGDERGYIMTRIPSHSIEDAPQESRALLGEMVQFSPTGRLLNLHAQMAHAPAGLEAYVSIRRATARPGTMEAPIR